MRDAGIRIDHLDTHHHLGFLPVVGRTVEAVARKHGIEAIRSAIDAGEKDRARTMLSETFSLIDKMSGKGIIHDNAAGRYKSRIAKRLAAKSARA